jgi:hypothetical protein
MVRNAPGELSALHRWLDLKPGQGDAVEFPKLNAIAGTVAAARGPNLLHRIGRTGAYQRLARTLVPSPVRDAVRSALSRPVRGDELRDPAAIDYLRETLAPSIAAFAELTGRAFPEWTESGP